MVIALPSCETFRANEGKAMNKKKAEINKKIEDAMNITDDQVNNGITEKKDGNRIHAHGLFIQELK
jgi:hypothetical protein